MAPGGDGPEDTTDTEDHAIVDRPDEATGAPVPDLPDDRPAVAGDAGPGSAAAVPTAGAMSVDPPAGGAGGPGVTSAVTGHSSAPGARTDGTAGLGARQEPAAGAAIAAEATDPEPGPPGDATAGIEPPGAAVSTEADAIIGAPASGLGSKGWLLLGATLVVVALGAYAFVVGRHTAKVAKRPIPSATTTTAPPGSAGVTIHDVAGGFTITRPASWIQVNNPGNSDALLLSAGGLDAMDVHVFPLQSPVAPKDMQAFTDAILSGSQIKVLKQQAVVINGMQGYYYLYLFTDSKTGQQGVHAHYFLFQGAKMYTLLFQALPTSDFARLAPVFDQVANSFRGEPGPAPTTPSTTTTGPATTVPATTVAP